MSFSTSFPKKGPKLWVAVTLSAFLALSVGFVLVVTPILFFGGDMVKNKLMRNLGLQTGRTHYQLTYPPDPKHKATKGVTSTLVSKLPKQRMVGNASSATKIPESKKRRAKAKSSAQSGLTSLAQAVLKEARRFPGVKKVTYVGTSWIMQVSRLNYSVPPGCGFRGHTLHKLKVKWRSGSRTSIEIICTKKGNWDFKGITFSYISKGLKDGR